MHYKDKEEMSWLSGLLFYRSLPVSPLSTVCLFSSRVSMGSVVSSPWRYFTIHNKYISIDITDGASDMIKCELKRSATINGLHILLHSPMGPECSKAKFTNSYDRREVK